MAAYSTINILQSLGRHELVLCMVITKITDDQDMATKELGEEVDEVNADEVKQETTFLLWLVMNTQCSCLAVVQYHLEEHCLQPDEGVVDSELANGGLSYSRQ